MNKNSTSCLLSYLKVYLRLGWGLNEIILILFWIKKMIIIILHLFSLMLKNILWWSLILILYTTWVAHLKLLVLQKWVSDAWRQIICLCKLYCIFRLACSCIARLTNGYLFKWILIKSCLWFRNKTINLIWWISFLHL